MLIKGLCRHDRRWSDAKISNADGSDMELSEWEGAWHVPFVSLNALSAVNDCPIS